MRKEIRAAGSAGSSYPRGKAEIHSLGAAATRGVGDHGGGGGRADGLGLRQIEKGAGSP